MDDNILSCDSPASSVMEVASGEYGEQMVRLVKAVQRDDQTELNGDTNLQPLLWQRAEEVIKRTHTHTDISHLSSIAHQ